MQIHAILTYNDGSHDEPFYILTEDDYALAHALEVIMNSPDVDYFDIDGKNGPDFIIELDKKNVPPSLSPFDTDCEP